MHSSKTTELKSLGTKIETWRASNHLSKNALCKQFGQLGSTKTYGRVIDPEDALDDLNIDGQLANYLAAWDLIQAFKQNPKDTEIYADFDHIMDATTAVAEALQEPADSISRLVLITGDTGSGKSTAVKILETHPATANVTYSIEATEAWRESENELLGALLMEIGIFDKADDESGEKKKKDPRAGLPAGAGARLQKLIDRIDGRRLIIIIDEAHHIGPAGFNLVKTLINQTSAVFVLCGMTELILRINRTSHAECRQLFFNRLYKHIRLDAPEPGPVLEFFKRRGIIFETALEASQISNRVAQDSKGFGNWKYLVRCAKESRKRPNKPHTFETFVAITTAVKRHISLA